MSGIFDQIINYTPPVLGGAGVVNAGSLTGTTLAANVTASSLTSLGTIANLTATAGTIATTPSSSTDIANKLYVDTVAQGLDAKASCRVATTANITLSGAQTIDGISVVAGNRVLVKNQTLTQNNGIYLCDAGTWTRTSDANTWDSLVSCFVFIERGTVNADSGYVCTVDEGGTLGTTAVTFVQFSSAGSFSAGNGLTLTGSVFSLNTPVSFANGGTNATSAPQSVARSMGFTSTVTAAGTTALTNTSTSYQLFTGTTTQTVTLPVTSTLERGWVFRIINNSTGVVTVNSSGANLVASLPAGVTAFCTCIGTTLTTAADWEAGFTDFSTLTGTGSVVLSASPTLSGTIAGTYTLGGAPTITPTLRSSGATPYLTITTPADTNRTAATESIGLSLTAATRQWATGALTLQRERVFAAPTYSFVGASTLTTAINVDIADPIQGTNATLTNIFGLRFNRGQFTNQLVSTVATGTAPFVVASTTNIPNLNASSLNGATFAAPGAIGSVAASTGAFTTLSATGAGFNGGFARFESTNSGNSIDIKGVNGAGVNDSAFITLRDGTSGRDSFIGLTGDNAPGGAGAIRFATGGNVVRATITSTGNIGFGTASPLSFALQTLQFDSGTLNTALVVTAYGASPAINVRNAGGTAASPSASSSNPINFVGATTNDGTNFSNTVSIVGGIESTPASGSHPTFLSVSTTPSGSTSRAERFRITSAGNIGIGTTDQFGGGVKVVGIANATTVPASNPTAGGVLYVESGALKYRGSSGTVTTIANA
jgi:hypothetical protein